LRHALSADAIKQRLYSIIALQTVCLDVVERVCLRRASYQ
jgi:hypothetical protein